MKGQPHVRPLKGGDLGGTPAQVTETLRGAIAQGADRITVHLADSPHAEGTYLFAATVLPHL